MLGRVPSQSDGKAKWGAGSGNEKPYNKMCGAVKRATFRGAHKNRIVAIGTQSTQTRREPVCQSDEDEMLAGKPHAQHFGGKPPKWQETPNPPTNLVWQTLNLIKDVGGQTSFTIAALQGFAGRRST